MTQEKSVMDSTNLEHQFECRFCEKKSSLKNYLRHLAHHRHLTTNYPCGVRTCSRIFPSESAFRTHVVKYHNIRVSQMNVNVPLSAISQSATFVCNLTHCLQKLDSFKGLVRHLKDHISNGFTVKCPFPECRKKYKVINSLKGHISRDHRCDWKTLREAQNVNEAAEFGDDFHDMSFTADANQSSVESADADCDAHEVWLQSFANFFMRLEFSYLIPQRTVQCIAEELHNVNSMCFQAVFQRLKECLSRENVPNEAAESILKVCLNPLETHFESLKTSYKRKKFYKKTYPFVEPKKIFIGDTTFYYYVPIIETLTAMLKSKSLNIIHTEHQPPIPGVLRDFHDGTAYKTNTFFQENPEALRLIIFQDAFEIVSALGPAKLKHKVLGIYLSVGNLPDYVRTHVNSIQLIALCKDKELDHDKVFGPIVDDLLTLESEGIFVPGKGLVKAALVFICGDNLGSHGVGGYVENFSTSRYFCRYCLIDRQSFYSQGGHYLKFEPRSTDSYNLGLCGNTVATRRGIKFNSQFNRSNQFHVCRNGLPPCLGHDIMEGIAKYDVALTIHHLVSEGWFTYDELNEFIRSFPYSPEDRRDKPIEFPPDSKKVRGGAWQINNFIKLFSIMVERNIKDKNDPVWLAHLILVEIIEIVCAPEVHVSYLGYLQSLIYEYLDLRIQNFPRIPLLPKHHYVTHYPELIMIFGPLMKVWTLRFESKHQFFSRSAKSCRNYINIMYSLASRHELFQTFLRIGADTRCYWNFINSRDFDGTYYDREIQQAVRSANLGTNVLECTKAVVKGTVYQKGKILALWHRTYQLEVEFGRIILILYSTHDDVAFLVEVLNSEFQYSTRAFRLGDAKGYSCVLYSNLLSYHPLHAYKYNQQTLVKLKHALVSRELKIK